ncbi:MAG: three-Cys-motif partner protein TcmP [Synergistaceae bacterium]|nr:three-Cys-motif partner protein TcmP [Synergistaceae bacterium]
MSKDANSFFLSKKEWSAVKDELLSCYLTPYIQKILATRKPLLYVDCFAGKGRFQDGSPGSPIIALDVIKECLKQTKFPNTIVECRFIEANHVDELTVNIAGYENCQIIPGKYQEVIEELLKWKRGYNAFFYVDPYGVKDLNCSIFDKFTQHKFNSVEMLINMNSFGFVRAACSAMQTSYDDIERFDDVIVEYDPFEFDFLPQLAQKLSDIAGGDYWRKIIEDYKAGQFDGYEAEMQFASQYCQRLREKYRYVLNMPIRVKEKHRPKYRMIHVTNHPDGCVLMYENILKRWERLALIQRQGQNLLFDETIENETVDEQEVTKNLKQHLAKYSDYSSWREILATFLTEYGILCKKDILINIMRRIEKEGFIVVYRHPARTKTGKPTSFYAEDSNQQVMIRRKS